MGGKRNLFLTPLLLLWLAALAACGRDSSPNASTAGVEPSTTPIATPTPIASPDPGTLKVEPAADLGPISPYIFGSNYGPWVAVTVDMLPYAYDSGVRAIRFPGGAWGDRNDLKSYQIDPFIDFCRKVGAMPTISVRLRQGTSEQAAELVRYVNIEKQNGVTYWSIGNEPTLFAAELQTLGIADDYDTEQFNREWREFALAMKAVDPTIKLIGPEVHQFNYNPDANPRDSSGRDWMFEFLKADGDLVDVVSFHRYPFPRGDSPSMTVEDLRRQTREWDLIIAYLRSLMMTYAGRELPIALTEVNTLWNQAIGGEATPDSHYNAIWLAELIGRAINQDVFMVNQWMLTSSGGQGGWGLLGRSEPRPSYYVYQLFKRFGGEQVYAGSGVEDLSIYAARRDDGALTVILINLADSEKSAPLTIAGEAPGEPELWRLDQTQNPESGRRFSFPAEGTVTLPPQSVSLYIFGP